MSSSLEQVIAEIVTWQKETFPAATQKSRATHLLREAAELYADPEDHMEMVDAIFMLLGMVDNAGMNLEWALRYKLEINKARQWGKPDESGVVEHVHARLGGNIE